VSRYPLFRNTRPFWGLYGSFAAEKDYYNAQSQQAINAFLSYGKNEVKKDFALLIT
jgi:hypothetical protein